MTAIPRVVAGRKKAGREVWDDVEWGRSQVIDGQSSFVAPGVELWQLGGCLMKQRGPGIRPEAEHAAAGRRTETWRATEGPASVKAGDG